MRSSKDIQTLGENSTSILLKTLNKQREGALHTTVSDRREGRNDEAKLPAISFHKIFNKEYRYHLTVSKDSIEFKIHSNNLITIFKYYFQLIMKLINYLILERKALYNCFNFILFESGYINLYEITIYVI